jgi:hypothetical protein
MNPARRTYFPLAAAGLLLKRVFAIDMENCPNCGGKLKVIAAILETAGIERIVEHSEHLAHLGLPARR